MAVNIYIPPTDRIVHLTDVDFSYREVKKQIHIVQYDKELPIIAVSLYVSSEPYVIPETMDIRVRWGKRDKTFIYKPVLGCNATRTIVYFDVDEQMSFLPGPVDPILELVLYSGDTFHKAGSSSIPIQIERNPIQDSDLESDSEYIVLDQAVVDAQNAAADSEASANESKGYRDQAEDARDASVVAKNASETAKGQSEAARDASVVAKNASETARDESEDARDASVVAKNASETAKGQSESARDASVVAKNASETAKDQAEAALDQLLDTIEPWATIDDDTAIPIAKLSNLQIGGRNLLLDSGEYVKNSDYDIKNYSYTSPLIVGETYTFSIKGKLHPSKSAFIVQISTNTSTDVDLYHSDFDSNGIASKTFVLTHPRKARLSVYSYPSSITGVESEIEWIKLERGNKATDHTPAPEEMVSKAELLDENDIIIPEKLPQIPAEKLNELNIGGRNLLLNSDAYIKNNANLIAEYPITTQLSEGEIVTLTLKGKLGEGKTEFRFENTTPTPNPWIYLQNIGDDLHRATFNWMVVSSNDKINMYVFPVSPDAESEIEWIQLERGNKATDRTPAPEDKQDKLISGTNIKTVGSQSLLGSGDIPMPTELPNPKKLKITYRNQDYEYDGSFEANYEFDFDHYHTEEDIRSSIVDVTDGSTSTSFYPKGKTVCMDRPTLSTFTVDPDGTAGITHGAGTEITVIRRGLGEVEIIAEEGVILLSHDNKMFINGQYQAIMLLKDITPNTWFLIGALKA